jgi:REP element-mobilizing transposase RayT
VILECADFGVRRQSVAATTLWITTRRPPPREFHEDWHNFWETRLTHEGSYLARLNYVHQNPLKQGLVEVAKQYPWVPRDGLKERQNQRK